jgi:hypothetical protein
MKKFSNARPIPDSDIVVELDDAADAELVEVFICEFEFGCEIDVGVWHGNCHGVYTLLFSAFNCNGFKRSVGVEQHDGQPVRRELFEHRVSCFNAGGVEGAM